MLLDGVPAIGAEEDDSTPRPSNAGHFRGIMGVVLDMFDDFVAEYEIESIVSKGNMFADTLDDALRRFKSRNRAIEFNFQAKALLAVGSKCL
jgi:hypothetical protein